MSANGRLYQDLARRLQAAIASGRYKVGERLPAERDLAADYKVSRPTVREAVIALEVQGVVEVRIGSGIYVRNTQAQMQARGADASFNISAFELTEARFLFESEAAALAATLISDEDLDRLEELLVLIDDQEDTPAAESADYEFHMVIARATRNQAIVKTVEDLWRMRTASPECASLFAKARVAQVKPVVEEHRRIAKALRARNADKARAAMRAHLAAVMDHLLFTTEEHAVEEARRAVQNTKARFRRAASR